MLIGEERNAAPPPLDSLLLFENGFNLFSLI